MTVRLAVAAAGLAVAAAGLAVAAAGLAAVGGATLAGAQLPPTLELTAPGDDRLPAVTPAIADLEDGDVVRLVLAGFAAHGTGQMRQCVYLDGDLATCANRFPVNFDDDGGAVVQYQLQADIAADRTACDGLVRPCTVVVADAEGNQAVGLTYFSPPPQPVEVTLSRSAGLRPGEPVEVAVRGAPPGTDLLVVECHPSRSWGPLSCSRTGTALPIDEAGHGVAVVPASGRALAVASADGDVWTNAPLVLVRVRAATGPGYGSGRTVVGAVVAAALLVLACWLWRRADWSTPSEAATPELDEAELA